MEIKKPKGLDYKDFQKLDIKLMCKQKSTLLNLDMGMGKTIEICGLINCARLVPKTLIVCPASLKLNWEREIHKWVVTKPIVEVVYSNKTPNLSADILIINYDIMPKYKPVLDSMYWDLVVLDEAHKIKNEKAKRTKAVKSIEAGKKIALTGTPILNRTIELWSLLDFLQPKEWSKKFHFGRRYCGAVKMPWGWEYKGQTNTPELKGRLKNLMIKRNKLNHLTELPSKTRQIIELENPNDDENKLMQLVLDKVGVSKSSELNEEQFRSACSLLSIGNTDLDFENLSNIRKETALRKVPIVLEQLKNATGKVICFAHHTEVIDILTKELGDEAVKLTGSTPINKRQEAVDRFQNDSKVKYFIGNIQAAGVGITLTASSHVMFAELSWTPGEVAQAEDRAWRMGQKNAVLVQHLVFKDSIDSYMARSIVKKQNAIDAIMEEDNESSNT